MSEKETAPDDDEIFAVRGDFGSLPTTSVGRASPPLPNVRRSSYPVTDATG